MGDAGAAEQLPLLVVDGILVTHRQRHQDTGIRPLMQRPLKALTDIFAQRFDQMTRRRHEWRQAPVVWRRSHVTGGADAGLKQPGLVIEAEGIQVAMRPFQAHRELPAFAGMQLGRGMQLGFFDFIQLAPPAAIPGEGNPFGHAGIRLLDAEIKAQAVLEGLRHGADHPNQVQVASLVGFRQRIGKAQLRHAASPGDAEQEGAHRRSATPALGGQRQQQQEHGGTRQQIQQCRLGQAGLRLQPGYANGKTEDGQSHAWVDPATAVSRD